MENVNLSTFAGGQLQQKFNMAFGQVLANLQDPNTPYKNKRKICVEISFEQNEQRSDVAVGVSVSTKLASVSPTKTALYTAKDLDTGEIYFQEYGNQVAGQMMFAADVDKNISVEDTQNSDGNVVDFRKVE